MWECPECGALFSAGSATSTEDGYGITEGVECPECGAFVDMEIDVWGDGEDADILE